MPQRKVSTMLTRILLTKVLRTGLLGVALLTAAGCGDDECWSPFSYASGECGNPRLQQGEEVFTVTAVAGEGGAITPPSLAVKFGETGLFTVTPDEGFEVATVEGCEGSLAEAAYTTGPITAACTVTAAFERKRYTLTATAGDGGTITPAETEVEHGATAVFTLAPDTGYHVDAVSGCGGALDGDTYTTGPVTEACTVTATFAINVYTVESGGSIGGVVTPASSSVTHGETADFVVAPDTGYHIVSVTGCEGTLMGNTYATGVVTADCTVWAEFELNQYDVASSAGANGAISPASVSVTHGDTTDFLVAPDVGYHVLAIDGCGGALAGNTWTTGVITGPCTVSVTFELNSYTVSASAGSGGSVSPASSSVLHGDTTSVTITPDTGYHITSVTGCGGSLSGNTYTTGAITAACTVDATFAINTYAVSTSAGSGGSFSPASAVVNHGSTTSFTVVPDTGYHVDTISGCGGSLSGNTYTTGAITAACTVSATFALNEYTVSATAGSGGAISPASSPVLHGSTTSFTVTPDTGYHIDTVTGCGGSLSGNTYTTGTVTGACTVSATFAINTYAVSTSAGSGGSMSPTGATIEHGSTTSFTLTPDTGYHIDTASGCGGSLSGNTYTTGAITAACTVSATFALNSYTVSTSAGSGGSLSPASASVLHGSTTSFTVTPDTGYHIDSVSGCGGALSGNTYTTGTITGACTVTATFLINTYTVTSSAGSGGTISPASVGVNHGSTTSFTLTPDTGYHIDTVSGCGGSLSGSTYTTGAITAACTVSATFALNSYTVSTSAGAGGSFSPASTSVLHGSTGSFTVTPDTGYHIDAVSGCGGSLSGSTYTTGVITAACTVTATFLINTYTVTATAGLNGSISPASATVDHGSTTSFTLTPDTGYHIDTVTGCGGSLSGNTYTTGAVTGACTVSASFALNTYTVSTSAGTGGSITPGSRTVSHGDFADFTVVADTGYTLNSVSGCGGTLVGNTYTTGIVTAACTVTATFTLNSYTVTATAGLGGSISPASATVNHGSTTSFTVTPDTNYAISGVSGCGGSLSGNTYTTGAITGACTVTASFALKQYTVSTSAGAGGSISPTSATVTHGQTTSFTITPSTGYSIGSVSGCGGSLVGNTYTTGAVTAACTVSASFNVNSYTVTASAGSGGSISPGSATVNHGSTTSFTVLANSGYAIGSVTGCGGTLSGNTYTTGAITAACSVTASFNSVIMTYDFSNLGTDTGGFKPQGNRWLVSTLFKNDTSFPGVMYYDDAGTSISGAIIKVDGTNLESFDLVNVHFSGYVAETMSMTITATLKSGGTISRTVSNVSVPQGVSTSLTSMGVDLTGFDNVTQLSFNITAGQVYNINFDSITISDQRAPGVAGTTPTTQASALTAVSVAADEMSLAWTNGSGTRRIVLAKQGATTGSPAVYDGITYAANSNFGSAVDIGDGWKVVYTGTGNSLTLTGLTGGAAYRIVVYEYDGLGGGEKYLTTLGTNVLNKNTSSVVATWAQGTARTLYAKNFYAYPVAALGTDGYTYVAHHDYDSDSESAKRIVISKWNGSSWSTHTSFVASDAGVTTLSDDLSIAVDSSNVIHLAFKGEIGSGVTSNRGVLYARYDGSWLFEQVELNSHPNGWLNIDNPVLTVDPSQNAHIQYVLNDASTFTQYAKLASRTGANTWSISTWNSVSSSGSTQVREYDLKADSNGKLHMIYVQGPSSGTRSVRYRTNSGGSWSDTELASNDVGIQFVYVELDASNKVHTAYSQGTSSGYDIVYGTNAGGSWAINTVYTATAYSTYGIRRNSSGEMVMVLGSGSAYRIFYKATSGSSWELTNASPTDSDQDWYAGVTFSNDGRVVIVYPNALATRPRELLYFQATLP